MTVSTAGCASDSSADSDGSAPSGGPESRQYGYGGVPTVASSAALAAAATSESEPNDTRPDATPITQGTAVSGSIDGDEVDWYAVETTDGETLTVTYDPGSSMGVTAVVLYGPDGNFLDQIYASASSPVELTETVAAGTHHVQVVDIENGQGEYTLTVGSGDVDTSTATPTPTPTPTPTATPEDDYGTQGYGQYGYGGVS